MNIWRWMQMMIGKKINKMQESDQIDKIISSWIKPRTFYSFCKNYPTVKDWHELINYVAKSYASQFKPKWIKCSDRLPENDGSYIIYGRFTKDCPKEVVEAQYTAHNRRFHQDHVISKDVTHWQYLPENPND